MTVDRLSAARLLALDEQGRLLVDATEQVGLDAAVPSCPGWSTADLLRHVGLVHRWATAVVQAGVEIDQDAYDAGVQLPADGALVDWVRAGHQQLVRTLRVLPEDFACWVLVDSPVSPRDFWIRRQLHETAIHRIDAELAAGLAPSPMDPALAADGIDELLSVLVPAGPFRSYRAASWAWVAADVRTAWTVTAMDARAVTTQELSPAHVTITGAADAVYRYAWNRPADGVSVAGDPTMVGVWQQGSRVVR